VRFARRPHQPFCGTHERFFDFASGKNASLTKMTPEFAVWGTIVVTQDVDSVIPGSYMFTESGLEI